MLSTLLSPTSAHACSTHACMRLGYAQSSGAADLRLFRNGALVKIWRGALPLNGGRGEFQTQVPLTAGENRFVAYAFNCDNVKTADAVTTGPRFAPKIAICSPGATPPLLKLDVLTMVFASIT